MARCNLSLACVSESGAFKFGSPRGLLVVLSVGGGISLVLMLTTMWLTDRQSVYSDAINNAGRLRFLTERFGSHLITKQLLGENAWTKDFTLPDAPDILQDVDIICTQLLGESLQEHSRYHAPQVPDSDIRDELQSWKKRLQFLNETGTAMARSNRSDPAELLHFREDVVHLVNAMDNIVTLLSEEAQYWIWIMLRLHLIRMVWQAFFYCWLTVVFKWIWIPFVKAFNDLQKIRQQQHSLLRADFDAVVEISTSHPFEIRTSCNAFDDLVGKPMSGESILVAASNDQAKASLADFLLAGFGVQPPMKPKQKSWIDQLAIFAWPRMEGATSNYDCPLAPKINSKWNHDVELLIVGRSVQSEEEKIALVAVRQIGPVERETEATNPSNATQRSKSQSEDFASWSEALQVKCGRDDVPRQVTPALPEMVCNFASADAGYAIPQSSARSSGTSRISLGLGNYTKRKLLDLGRVEVALDDMSDLKAYSLRFVNDDLDEMPCPQASTCSRQQPDFMSCLVGKPKNDFIRWWQESTNTMLYKDYVHYLDYEGEVWFRPPTAACASSKLVLCAESVRCLRSLKDTSFRWSLQFHNISQLIKCQNPSGGQLTAQRLPKLSETTFSL